MQESSRRQVVRRPDRRSVWSRVFVIVSVLSSLMLPPVATLGDGRAAAEPLSQMAVRYYGRLMLSNTPAPTGTVITAIAIPRWPTVVVCGTTTVNDQLGSYSLDIQPIPPVCVRQGPSDPPADYIFMANGENVGNTRNSASLAAPATLAQAVQRDLNGTLIDGLSFDAGADPHPISVRYYGILRGGNQPAPVGTTITITSATPGVVGTPCGTGAVQNQLGFFWVDVPTTAPGCVRATANDPPADYVFYVNGENVGSMRNSASLAAPATLAQAVRRDLNGRAPFPSPTPSPTPSPSPAPNQDPAQPAPDTSPTPPADQPTDQSGGSPPDETDLVFSAPPR